MIRAPARSTLILTLFPFTTLFGAGLYPALRVLPTTVFETQSSATVAATLVGSKVTLGADAASVTATTDSGVFTIDWTDGAATNSRVRGHFE